jgi:hypothetical protein
VVLGWKGSEESDSAGPGPTPTYTLELPTGLAGEWSLDGGASFQLSLAATKKGDDDAPAPDLSVEVEDAGGRTARVALSRYGPVRRPLEIRIQRRAVHEAAQRWELVLQTYVMPLSDFTAASEGLDLQSLVAVRLVFDRVPEGEVVVDEIGFSRLHPAFWSARVP